MFAWNALPGWIAFFNLLSAVLLVGGLLAIHRRRIRAHRTCMISAFSASVLFLVIYLLDHFHNGIVYYRGAHPTAYLWLLGTHSLLASAVPFLAVITLVLALRSRFFRHRQWARWTWPIWMYVSVTGVAVYWVLYR